MKKSKSTENPYFLQAKLMMEVMPAVAAEECFALKGGTAINFFLRDMPRLSVDIDLTYLPVEDRPTSLGKIDTALKSIAKRIHGTNPDLEVQEGKTKGTTTTSKLFVSYARTQVKIEPNLTLRGTAFKPCSKRVSAAVETAFEASVAMTLVSDGDLYGGKICAALDRQHPRDLFDVKFLLEDQSVTEEIRQGFIVYLAGHDETISDLLDPKKRDIAASFKNEFQGMPRIEVPLSELLRARDQLISAINDGLTKPERQFLLSLKEGDPQWNLLPIPGIDRLPAIQWKLQNIRKMDPALRKKQAGRLRKILGL